MVAGRPDEAQGVAVALPVEHGVDGGDAGARPARAGDLDRVGPDSGVGVEPASTGGGEVAQSGDIARVVDAGQRVIRRRAERHIRPVPELMLTVQLGVDGGEPAGVLRM